MPPLPCCAVLCTHRCSGRKIYVVNAREKLLLTMLHGFVETKSITGRAEPSPNVLAAFRAVNREDFVPLDERNKAYRDRPLPIGFGQTISQPFLVAFMTEVLEPAADHVVLEVGTGSGYQTAMLAEIVRAVYSIEVVPDLAVHAAQRLSDLGYHNVSVRSSDGYAGWPEHAPYDRIIVTAAAPYVPRALLDQLEAGGRMVIPVGPPGLRQDLVLVTKDAHGGLSERSILPVAFVPMVRS